MFRGVENALPLNWLHVPVAYNGSASTVVVSGTEIQRPMEKIKAADKILSSWNSSKQMDFKLELGAIIGANTEMGAHITVAEADKMIFGYVLLND